MQICVLNGSPRLHGNTAELLKPFVEVLQQSDVTLNNYTLVQMNVASCKGCYHCQDVQGEYGCYQKDDMHTIAKAIMESDLIVLATPIYIWYCTPELKAVLDRFYGLAKFYRSAKGNFVEGKRVAILATHGYDAAYAADPFVIGIQRMCDHYHMRYDGMYSVRDVDDLASFQTKQAISGAKEFAQYLLNKKA
ncbi:MAG: NADPH-dependent FMN reductase [Firmicutes bacterium HGW-Firmicutes-9]|jgi:multimeric flavodoxin WrbA|nr:MAG: NADPH-dependent FMN reductase [Firmicutes bacterium HGW-Firmicutes-9]